MNIRKVTTRAGFEFIFAAGIAAIFIIPSAVMAQADKNIEISITNGDTVINGKNIKTLSGNERREALKDLEKITGATTRAKTFRYDRKTNGDINTNGDLGESGLDIRKTPNGFIVEGTDDGHNRPLHLKRRMKDSTIERTFTFKITPPEPPMGDMPERGNRELRMDRRDGDYNFDSPRGRMGRRNSQSFSYTNTDAQGISTNVIYRIFEPGDRMRSTSGTEKSDLNIADIKLISDFSSGKTTLMFNLPTKTSAEVQLSDSNGNVLWAEKSTSATFSKSFPLPLNGLYQLKVKQGGKTAIKQILKEQ